MGRTAFVMLVDGNMEFSNVADWYTTEDGFVGLCDENNVDIAVFHATQVKIIAFRDKKPEPPAPMPSGHNCVEKTGFSAGDRAVVLQSCDPWNCLTVDIVGHIADDPDLIVTKRRGEVACRLYHRNNLRPVPEARRNESR